MRRGFRRSGPESGVAILEYILILVIIVVIALSLLYQFNHTFKTYAGMLFDGYYRCLMETGELPGTGTQCSAEFGNFDMKSGKKLVSENAGFGPMGSGADGANGSDANKKDGSKDAAGKGGEKTGRNRGGRNASTGVGSMGRSGRFKSAPMGKLATTSGEVASQASESPGQNMTPVRSVGYVNQRRRARALSMSYFVSGDTEEKKRTEARPASASVAVGNNDQAALRPSKRPYTPPRAPAEAGDTDAGGGFTFGKLIRTLIIVALIMAIVVFFGGQLLQISKSGEKGGSE